jgi:hypothetical protein
VRNQHRRDAGVIIDDLPLGKSGRRIKNFVKIGEAKISAFDFDDL